MPRFPEVSPRGNSQPTRARTKKRTTYRPLKLEWLESFIATVDSGGFAAAARNTYRSQPRVSAHISELERHLNATLFDRRRQGAHLTPAGAVLLVHARAVVQHLMDSEGEIRDLLDHPQGNVRIGCYPSVGAAFVPAIIRSYAVRYPGAQVTLIEVPTIELDTLIAEGDVDLILRPMFPHPPAHLAHYKLWEEPLVAVIPSHHELLERRETVTLQALAPYPLIGVHPGDGSDNRSVFSEVHECLRMAQIHGRFSFYTDQPQTLIGLVREGLGIGVTNLLSAAISDHSDVRIEPIIGAAYSRSVGVYWNPRLSTSAAVMAMLEAIRAEPIPAAIASLTDSPNPPDERAATDRSLTDTDR